MPEEQNFDIEIYHFDPEVVESNANALHLLDGYRGNFGDGSVQQILVDDQNDDYQPRVDFGDDLFFQVAFIRVEVRLYSPLPLT